MKKSVFFLLILGFPAWGQKQVHDQTQAWTGYFNQTRLSDRWGFWLDLHARRTDFLDRWSTQIVRPGVTYYFNDHLRFTAGYAYVAHHPAPGLTTIRPEHRPWQQILWTSRSKRLQTQQWVRLEQRFNGRVVNDELQNGYLFNWKFRYLLTLMVPLNRDYIEPRTLFFAFNDEVHINAGKNITYNYFDQNRLFVGLGYQFSKSVNAQLGYMNLFQQHAAGNQFTNNHVVRLFVFHNLDLRAPKP